MSMRQAAAKRSLSKLGLANTKRLTRDLAPIGPLREHPLPVGASFFF